MRELYIWGKVHDLPTIDPQCMVILSYLSIVSDEYKIIECNDPQLSPNGELPMLHDGKNWISGTSRIISYMKKIGYDADEHLTPEEKAKVTAYSALLEDKLNDAILFSWFADSENFLSWTRPAFSNLLSFPARYFLPLQMRKNAVLRVEKYGGSLRGHELIDIDNTTIYDSARDCYRALERMLGTQDFFLGDRPCTLDAMAFGYMSLQLFAKVPNPRFEMIITTQYPRLADFCERMRTECFANLPDPSSPTEESPFFSNIFAAGNQWFRNTFFTPKPVVTSAEEDAKKKEKTPEEKDFELKRIYAVTFGVVAMVAYVIVNGLVVIGDEEEEEATYEQGFQGELPPFMNTLMEDVSTPVEEYDDDE